MAGIQEKCIPSLSPGFHWLEDEELVAQGAAVERSGAQLRWVGGGVTSEDGFDQVGRVSMTMGGDLSDEALTDEAPQGIHEGMEEEERGRQTGRLTSSLQKAALGNKGLKL